MFNNQMFCTKGIQMKIPGPLQTILWYMIEIMEVDEKDHLQVFELSMIHQDGKDKQRIIHRQEQPPYQKEHIISIAKPVTAKIFVIDDGDHSTMLMASEY